MNYKGIEKKKDDARSLNHTLIAAISNATDSIKDEIKFNRLRRKIVIQQIK